MRSRGRILWAMAGAAVIVVGVLAWASPGFRELADQSGSVFGGVAALVGIPVAVWALGERLRPAPAAPLERLARLAERQWTDEAGRRRLTEETSMPVRWRWDESARGVRVAEIFPGGDQPPSTGLVVDLADLWRSLPAGRLVVLGKPGAGKSSAALLLTCALLRGRVADGVVPVLADVSGWRPSEEYEEWLSRTLAERFGWRDVAGKVADLVRDRKVVPVLDGFDELPAGDRLLLISAIGAHPDRPVVLMSRIDEFTAAIGQSDPLLATLVVKLEDLPPTMAARHLPVGQRHDPEHWAPVQAVVTSGTPLSEVLSNPLMLSLAQAAFKRPGSVPRDLDELSAKDVESRLFDGYLKGLYDDPATATRWLARLARLMPERNFAWWRIEPVVEKRMLRLIRFVTGLVVLPPMALAFLVFSQFPSGGGWFPPALAGLIAVGLIGTWFQKPSVVNPPPRRVQVQAGSFVIAMAAGLGFCLPAVLVILSGGTADPTAQWLLLVPALLLGPAAMVVFLWVVIRSGWRQRDRDSATLIPVRGPGGPAAFVALGWMLLIQVALDIAQDPAQQGRTLQICLVLLLFTGVPLGLYYAVAVALVEPAPEKDLWSPGRALRADRAALWGPPLVLMAVFAVDAGIDQVRDGRLTMPVIELLGLLTGLLVWANSAVEGSAWISFTVVRCRLAIRGELPWRLMSSLAEAERLGVLRRDGAVYQFRHERLRGYLAEGRVADPLPEVQN